MSPGGTFCSGSLGRREGWTCSPVGSWGKLGGLGRARPGGSSRWGGALGVGSPRVVRGDIVPLLALGGLWEALPGGASLSVTLTVGAPGAVRGNIVSCLA